MLTDYTVVVSYERTAVVVEVNKVHGSVIADTDDGADPDDYDDDDTNVA